MKRFIDLFGSLLLLAVLSPVLLCVTLTTLLSNGFPVLHLRRVVGPKGEFYAYKFRTMCRNADAMLDADVELRKAFTRNFKLRSDPRVTRIGRWLRKYSLDELPQLINVLQGQMSLVGPRMVTIQELSKYGEHKALLISVKPGLTGYWQVQGRQKVSYEERVRMDIYYITHRTVGLDLTILLKTPWAVIHADGAY